MSILAQRHACQHGIHTMRAALLTWKSHVAACAQVSVLDGNKYTTMCREAGEQCLEILEECTVCYQCFHATLQMTARSVHRTACLAVMHELSSSHMLQKVLKV